MNQFLNFLGLPGFDLVPNNSENNAPGDCISVLRLIDIDKVSELLRIGRSTIYDKMDKRSKYYDPDFPLPIYLGESTARFVLPELIFYIKKKMSERGDFERDRGSKKPGKKMEVKSD